MSDRSHGYNVSVEYKSYGFYREMAPDWLDFCVRSAGYEASRRGSVFRYLYLGSGQGFGLCVLAAANPDADFMGVDFQPEHIAHAQGLADAAGLSNVRFVEADFANLAAAWPADFGTFDYVALHGVLSWISPRLRTLVAQCLLHATHPGSLVYAGYSAQPGWISTIPFQHLSQVMNDAANRSPAAVLEEVTNLFDRLAACNAPIFSILPALKSRVDAVKSRDPTYFAHEYLTESWQPLWHSEVSKEFRPAKLDYVASATLGDSLLPEVLQPPLRNAIVEQPNNDLREDVQDFVINQGFRRDIFCRDARPLSGDFGKNGKTPLYLVPALEPNRPVNFQTSFGEVAMDYQILGPLVEALADGPKSVDELMAIPTRTEMQTKHALPLLLHSTILGVGAAEPGPVDTSKRLNAVIARAASGGVPYQALAAAKLGSGISVTDIDLMLLDSWLESQHEADASALAKGVSQRLQRLGRADDAKVETLKAVATTFVDQTLPRYRQLGVVE